VKHLEQLIFDDASERVDGFGWLLVLTATTIGLLTLVDIGEAAGTVVGTFLALSLAIASAATIVLALQASGVKRRITRIVAVLVMVGVIGVVLVLALDLFTDYNLTDPEARATAPVGYLVFTFVAPFVVVRRLARQGQVTVKTLTGAVTAYLLIALSFNYVFLTVDSFASTPFFGNPEPTTSFMYFSLVTITTLGYGDLVPAAPWGHLTASAEAVVGQVFLVTVVALVVGLLAQRRER
jgi:Ion channel